MDQRKCYFQTVMFVAIINSDNKFPRDYNLHDVKTLYHVKLRSDYIQIELGQILNKFHIFQKQFIMNPKVSLVDITTNWSSEIRDDGSTILCI